MPVQNLNIQFAAHPINPRFQDLTGHRVGRLIVLGYAGERKRSRYWFCQCDCGIIKTVAATNLKTDGTRSCGCFAQDRYGEMTRRHGEYQTGQTYANGNPKPTPEYVAFNTAKSRCTNPSHKSFAGYGGRGIEFRFESFEQFLQVLGRKPTPQHSVDRYPNNDGHYEPGNVRWATMKEQCQNRRNSKGTHKL